MGPVGIDVVFPIGSMNWVPYLKNACNGIRRQKYPQDMVGIVISYLYRNSSERLDELATVCRENNAVITMSKGKEDAFETPLCRNMGAIRTTRPFIAFIDCDVVLEPSTFDVAKNFLNEKQGVVIPVADMKYTPEDNFFMKETNKIEWDEAVNKNGRCRREAFGVVIVPSGAVFTIRGYDERMFGWGADDTDLVVRLKNHGVGMVEIGKHGCSFSMHQQHQTGSRESVFTGRNRHLFATSRTIIRNEGSWGGVKDSGGMRRVG